MKVRTILSVAVLASTLAFPGASFAQDEHMISGKAVPADEVAAVQAKCDELAKAAPAANNMAAAPAAGATAGWTADGKVDVANLTAALCDEGKFTAAK